MRLIDIISREIGTAARHRSVALKVRAQKSAGLSVEMTYVCKVNYAAGEGIDANFW